MTLEVLKLNSVEIPLQAWMCLNFIIGQYLNNDDVFVCLKQDIVTLQMNYQHYLTCDLEKTFDTRSTIIIVDDELNTINQFVKNIRGKLIIVTRNMNVTWEGGKYLRNIVLMPKDNFTEIYSLPFGKPMKLIEIWENGRLLNNTQLFPKPKFSQNYITVLPVYCQAFSYNFSLNGPEDLMVKTIAENLKLDVNYTKLPDDVFHYDVFSSNGSLSGFLGVLDHGAADYMYGCAQKTFTRSKYADALPSHFESKLVWSIAAPKKKTFTPELLSGLDEIIWLLIFVSLLLFSFLLLYLVARNNENPSRYHLVAFRLALTAPPGVNVRNDFIRVMILLYTIYSLFISCFYQSKLLINLFKYQYEKEIKTLEDAMSSNYNMVIYEPHVPAYLAYTSHVYPFTIITPGYDHSTVVISRNIIKLGIKHMDEKGYRWAFPRTRLSSLVTFLKEPVSTFTIVSYMPLGHPLLPKLTKKLEQINESGLFLFWFENERRSDSYFKRKSIQSQRPLRIRHLKSTFILFFVLMVINFFVFILEIILHGIKKWFSSFKQCVETIISELQM